MRITGGCLALVTFLWTVVSRGDKDVWCRLNESCLLQANFTVGQDVVIHWQKKLKEDIYAHSYYYSADQLQLQDKQFKNRTSLFKEHIKDGNSTLLLKKVVVADEGRYMCYVGTISEKKESFINLHVEAAVTTINIQQDGNNLTCSSSGIYPEPQLTWSTEPLLLHALQNATKVDNGTGETLYSISGWLVVAGDNTSQVDYICDVRSHSSRRLTWKNGSTVRVSGSETVINCPFLTGDRSVVWMFNNRTIVKMKNGAKDISEEWKEQVKDMSTSGNLGLHSLSSNHEGTYTCQVDNATETRVITFFLSTAGGDKDVWCRLNESCLLQANFTVGQDVVIHWQKKLKEDIYAHSYYNSVDQLLFQDKQFKNRTSLFKEHIKDGNSTLLLKKVVVADEGRYMCYVGTISEKKESFINLHVEAAVTTINIQQDGNNLTCSSSGIYPEPQLTWSTEPLLPHALQNATKVDNGTGETLYSISGWLVVAGDNTSQVDYICDVRSHSSRRLTWKNGCDKDVWCRLNESCLLQANFTVGQVEVIHWQKKLKEDIYAHSYYNSADQLLFQDKQFKNRTSLFKEHIKDGNSTLLLKKVVVADEGRYMCYVRTISEKKESFINLHVEAAVTTINIQQDGNNLTCSSSGIYPEPQLTWSTEPLLPHALQNATKVDNGTGETLYSISGWLVVAGDNTSQVDYICDVRSHSSRRLTWKNGSTVRVSGSETVINCPFLTGDRSVVWMFNNRTIVKMNNGAKEISEEWKEQVKDVSTSGNLGLHSLSSDHEGTYTCQVDNATETRVITFFLSTAGVSPSRLGRKSYWGILAVVLLVLVAAGFAYWKYKRSASNRPRSNPEEVTELNSVKDGGESQMSENERCLAGNNNRQADLS
ncbi:uncharacterized protein LOC133569153 isoform X2 [Nerophis ophidion]|uniref:uncharacterized protein LOC133569153 isoform X2 n=1 Tax=Nerophis ophidion TaxID=159077 RepID=UPI002ADF1C39|nr:uncharacterized protein LOC133569153 isoform X2 [Nerophis ophidion]